MDMQMMCCKEGQKDVIGRTSAEHARNTLVARQDMHTQQHYAVIKYLDENGSYSIIET